jgi:hypothetical protein
MQAFVEDALILAVPLLRCLDAPSFDPAYPFLDGPAARSVLLRSSRHFTSPILTHATYAHSVRLSCYDVVQLIATKANTAPPPPPVQPTSTSSACASSSVSLEAVVAGGRAGRGGAGVPAFLMGFLRCVLLHVILDLNSAEAASRLQRAPPDLAFIKVPPRTRTTAHAPPHTHTLVALTWWGMQRAFNGELKRVEGLVHAQSPASQRQEPLLARPEPSFLVTTRATFDLSIASDRVHPALAHPRECPHSMELSASPAGQDARTAGGPRSGRCRGGTAGRPRVRRTRPRSVSQRPTAGLWRHPQSRRS